MNSRVIFCSDVHLCHAAWYGKPSAERLDKMVNDLNELYAEHPYEKIIFLGDYSLDFWECEICGSWLREGVSNTVNFIKGYAERLKAPYYMIPGNHEQYGCEAWKKIAGTPRESCFTAGGYLFIACDNFAGSLDPDFHSDGTYTAVRLDFVKRKMREYPFLPVILCAHYFDLQKEPPEFFEFIKNEKRITFLICGHDHIVASEDMGERADHVCLYHDGHYSYAGEGKSLSEAGWGFCEAELRDNGVDIRYTVPAGNYEHEGEFTEFPACEMEHIFIKRRDI